MATEVAAKGTVRVVVVHENDLVREGLVVSLKSAPEIEVVGQAHDGAGAHSEVRRTVADVVLLDVHTSPFADPLPPDYYADASPRGGWMDVFTGRARGTVVLAREEARRLNHGHIGTEHLLLGVIRQGRGVAAKALESMGISLERVRQQVEETIGTGQSPPSGHIPFAPGARMALELSLREAYQLGHNYIGTEHILLGLIREGEGVAARVLIKLGVDLSRVRQQAIRQLSGASEPTESHDLVSLLRGLRDAFPTVGIVALLSADASPEIATVALKAGATTYVSKIDPVETIFAVRVAANMNKPEA